MARIPTKKQIIALIDSLQSFPINHQFYNNPTSKTIIYCFKSNISKVNQFYNGFHGTSIIKLFEGDK